MDETDVSGMISNGRAYAAKEPMRSMAGLQQCGQLVTFMLLLKLDVRLASRPAVNL
jgi:hypothetical protein